uniref:Uncharacterized protein n=1 Tax=Anopheles farauti TaxID=69004 RepID=A0A182QNL1_9DIPT
MGIETSGEWNVKCLGSLHPTQVTGVTGTRTPEMRSPWIKDRPGPSKQTATYVCRSAGPGSLIAFVPASRSKVSYPSPSHIVRSYGDDTRCRVLYACMHPELTGGWSPAVSRVVVRKLPIASIVWSSLRPRTSGDDDPGEEMRRDVVRTTVSRLYLLIARLLLLLLLLLLRLSVEEEI